MPDVSKLRLSGTSYNIKDAEARESIAAFTSDLTNVNDGLTSEATTRGNSDATLRSDINSEISNRMAADTELSNRIAQLQSSVGSPLVANTTSAMTDTTKIYVYTGNQSGYTNGNWYYHNGTSWVSGGVYNSSAVTTDVTLAISNVPADAYATGNRLDCISEDAKSLYDTGLTLLGRAIFRRDAYNPNTGAVNPFSYRISSRTPIVFPYGVTLSIASGFRFYPYLWSGSEWSAVGWRTGTYFVPANTQFHCQIGRTTDNTSEVASVPEFLNAIKVYGGPINIALDSIPKLNVLNQNPVFESGGWSSVSGVLQKSATTDCRLRTKELLQVPQAIKVHIKKDGVRVMIMFTTKDGEYISSELISWGPTATPYFNSVSGEAKFGANYGNYKFAVMLLFPNLSTAPSNLEEYVTISFLDDPVIKNGKQCRVYLFGGNGNHWCFVRTPANYNHFRVKPYPFVICNHGNGWVMDGSLQTANWTKRTMYVPTTDSDYISNPTQYNGTTDQSLWYSNPTIEALLNAGYIVCGCENYGDNLYGNDNCRNACVDFFYHMIKTYNVEQHCYMIGASNGGLTSLNAAYLLPGRIKAMILQYPLTCLVNQYMHYTAHRAGIRDAYGITDSDISEEDLAVAVATHDPYTTDVINGVKVGSLPPIKIWYSNSDSVALSAYNSVPFIALLNISRKVVDSVVAQGDHGDSSHFDPAAYVEWFEAHK